jgi:glucose uptake protein GlcU
VSDGRYIKPGDVVAGVLVCYLLFACVVFAFRHPCATQTQIVFHLLDAVTFRKLDCRSL